MGTAYLFTEEAVAAGAIQPLFQQQVVDAARTDLLETAPGHATRCAAQRLHRRLRRDQGPAQGRRRAPTATPGSSWSSSTSAGCASPARASSASATTCGRWTRTARATEGMFMAGEVAVLRDRVITRRRAARERRRRRGRAGCARPRRARLGRSAEEPTPAAASPSSAWPACSRARRTWRRSGRTSWPAKDSVTEVPRQRWDAGPVLRRGRRQASGRRRAGAASCPEIPFDPLALRHPAGLAGEHRAGPAAALEAARRALADAGYSAEPPTTPARRSSSARRRAATCPTRPRCARCCPLPRRDPGRAGRAAARADRGLVPRHAGQRHRRPDRQPAGPRRRQLHRRRGLRLLAGRGRRGLQGTDRRHQRPGAVRRRRPAQRHQRLPAVLLGARALADRPLGRPSTQPPTASRSARASRASCSSASPTPSATATGSTR